MQYQGLEQVFRCQVDGKKYLNKQTGGFELEQGIYLVELKTFRDENKLRLREEPAGRRQLKKYKAAAIRIESDPKFHIQGKVKGIIYAVESIFYPRPGFKGFSYAGC